MLWPFERLSPVWGLTIISIISGVVLLLVYGKVSNQKAIKKTKGKIYGHILEAILFRHDLKTSLKAQGGMFSSGLKYFVLAVPPIIILMIPCLAVLAQLNLRYNSEPLNPGEHAIFEVTLTDPTTLFDVTLKTPKGVHSTPPVRNIDTNQISWRLDVDTQVSYSSADNLLTIESSDKTLTTPIVIGNNHRNKDHGKIASQSYSSWWWRFFYPSDTILKETQDVFKETSLTYPDSSYNFLGMQSHWLVIFAIVSILSGIASSRLFNVEI